MSPKKRIRVVNGLPTLFTLGNLVCGFFAIVVAARVAKPERPIPADPDAVVTASGVGLPISTTHTLVGAVLGIGLARGIGALNLGMIGKIFSTWVVTLPAGALFAIIYLEIFILIFL